MKHRLIPIAACLALASTGIATAAAVPTTDRIGGIDRYDTAVKIAARTFQGHQDTVYIARGDLPVDALVAGQLTDGPVLLSPLNTTNPNTMQALQGYSPKEIIFLGKAFPASTVNAYTVSGAKSWVLGGKDRQETSALIAGRAFNGKPIYHLYVAGPDGVDAVASGALTDAPIVLSYPDGRVPSVSGLPAEMAKVCIGAACNYVPAKERIQGKDRFETAGLIAKRAFPNGFTKAYIGRSDNFIDAVVGGILTDAPILLVRPDGKGNTLINALNLAQATFLGGPGALPDNVLTLKPQQPKPSGLGLPWSGKIRPIWAGTGAYDGWQFRDYKEVYSWSSLAAFYGQSPNLGNSAVVDFFKGKNIITFGTMLTPDYKVDRVIFNKNWKQSDETNPSDTCNGELCGMTPQQRALYIQAHIDEFEVAVENAIQKRIPEYRLNLDRNQQLISGYREWASGMPRDYEGYADLGSYHKGGHQPIEHLFILPQNIVTQIMPSFAGSSVYEGILRSVPLNDNVTLSNGTRVHSNSIAEVAETVAEGYLLSPKGHWKWVETAGHSGKPFACGASAVTTHGPWFRPDTSGVMVGEGTVTVACGSLDMSRVTIHN